MAKKSNVKRKAETVQKLDMNFAHRKSSYPKELLDTLSKKYRSENGLTDFPYNGQRRKIYNLMREVDAPVSTYDLILLYWDKYQERVPFGSVSGSLTHLKQKGIIEQAGDGKYIVTATFE